MQPNPRKPPHTLGDSFLARLLEQSAQPFAVSDFGGEFLHANTAFREMLGYTQEEFQNINIDHINPRQYREAMNAYLEKIRLTGIPLRQEKEYRHKDGRLIPVEVAVDLCRDDDGKAIGYFAFVTNISKRKTVETAMAASERRARALFEGIEDAVFVHDSEGRILDANPAACRRLGYDREEMLKLTTKDIDDPEFAAGFAERTRTQIDQGRLTCEGRHRTKDGEVISVDINTSLIHFEGRPAVLAVMRDLTERKKLEETQRLFTEAQIRNGEEIARKNRELMRSESRYRQLTEATLDAVVVADDDGLVTLFNPAAERVFGYGSQEAMGLHLVELFVGGFSPDHKERFRTYLRSRDPHLVGKTVELTGRRKTGEEFPLELSLSAVDFEGQVHYIGSIRDQTERQRMRAMLVQSEKLASIGLLSAGVAHEINNPLAYVANNLAILERDFQGILNLVAIYERGEPLLESHAPALLGELRDLREDLDWDYVRENLQRVIGKTREGVQRVANIVQSLRGLARTSGPKMERVEIYELLNSPLEMIKSRLKRFRIELKIETKPTPKIECVPSQIGQVLLNLLVNAIQAIEVAERANGGLIRVVIEPRGENQTPVLEIHDNGTGIDTNQIHKLFDPFFTTKPVGEGTGLGLFICHEIITAHGGRIEVESRLGQGSCFRILWPLPQSKVEGKEKTGG